MKNTGALLKAKRESLKLSLSEVALATKINPKILAAIENGNETVLPAKTILRGFLKSYAAYLKMDVEEVLRTFVAESGPPQPPAAQAVSLQASVEAPVKAEAPSAPRRRVSEDEKSSGMRTAAVVVIVILIGLIIGVRELVEKYQREKVVEQVSDIKVVPVPAPSVAPTPAEQVPPPVAPPPPADSKPSVLVPPSPPPLVLAPTEEAPKPVEAPKPAETPKPVEPATKPEENKVVKVAKHEIILEALDKVEVKFQVKGETKKVSLGPTQVHTIHSDQPLTIDFSDGGAVNVILDGRERGVPGDLGKPKTIKIP